MFTDNGMLMLIEFSHCNIPNNEIATFEIVKIAYISELFITEQISDMQQLGEM